MCWLYILIFSFLKDTKKGFWPFHLIFSHIFQCSTLSFSFSFHVNVHSTDNSCVCVCVWVWGWVLILLCDSKFSHGSIICKLVDLVIWNYLYQVGLVFYPFLWFNLYLHLLKQRRSKLGKHHEKKKWIFELFRVHAWMGQKLTNLKYRTSGIICVHERWFEQTLCGV